MTFLSQIRSHPRTAVAIVAAVIIMAVVSFFLFGSFVNAYKERQFSKRQAAYESRIKEAEAKQAQAQIEIDKAKQEAVKVNERINQLESENAELSQEVANKKVIYVQSRKPNALRPNVDVSDADVRAIAAKHGLVIR